MSIEIDNTPPNITVNNIANEKYYNQDICFDAQIFDKNIAEYYIVFKENGDIQLSETGDINKNYNLCAKNESDYVLSIQAKDKSENIANISISFGIDKTSPEIHINEVDNEGVYYNELQPEIEIVEAHPENHRITLLVIQ